MLGFTAQLAYEGLSVKHNMTCIKVMVPMQGWCQLDIVQDQRLRDPAHDCCCIIVSNTGSINAGNRQLLLQMLVFVLEFLSRLVATVGLHGLCKRNTIDQDGKKAWTSSTMIAYAA